MEYEYIKEMANLPGSIQEQIKRREIRLNTFFANPYMQEDVKLLRQRYSIPEQGFNLTSGSEMKSLTWLETMKQQYSEPWQVMPKDIKQSRDSWNEATFGMSPAEEEEYLEHHMDDYPEPWEPDCLVNVKTFQEELRATYTVYDTIYPIHDYPLFELYVITGEVLSPIKRGWVYNQPFNHGGEVQIEQELHLGDKGIWQKHALAYTDLAEGQPEVLFKMNGDDVTCILINIKPNTIRKNVEIIWDGVKRLQKSMPAAKERIKELPNFERDLAMHRMVKIEGLTYKEAIVAWEKQHEEQDWGKLEESAVTRSVLDLERIFNPSRKRMVNNT